MTGHDWSASVFPGSNSAKVLSDSRSLGGSKNIWYTLTNYICSYLVYGPSVLAGPTRMRP